MFLNYMDYVTAYKETVTESNEERRIFIIDESEEAVKVDTVWECMNLSVLTVTYIVFVHF